MVGFLVGAGVAADANGLFFLTPGSWLPAPLLADIDQPPPSTWIRPVVKADSSDAR